MHHVHRRCGGSVAARGGGCGGRFGGLGGPVKILLAVLVAGAAMELPLDLPPCFAWMGSWAELKEKQPLNRWMETYEQRATLKSSR
jgi:hypothetical protein